MEICIRVNDKQICDNSVKKPLSMIYKTCIKTGICPNAWKKSNIGLVHTKGDKQIVNNYRPVSLLPIFGKVFEKILFNSIFEYLQENCLLCDNQSGFRPSDSCEYQLLSIVHDIYASFDCNPPKDVRGIFLDISKAFDRVWHEGLIYKMKCIGITGMPLKLLQSFLQNRHQRVLLNGQCSSWAPVFAGVPQGSVLGPLFFLIYINDLTKAISSTNKLFADDTSIFSIVNDIDVSEHELNSDLRKISMWAYQWKMSFNPDVSKQAQEVIFSERTQKLFHPTVLFNNIPVRHSIVQKHSGVYLDEKLNFR